MLLALSAFSDRIALNLDFRVGIGQRSNGNQSAARKIIAEYLSADLREAVAVANVSDKDSHLHHICELPARLFESPVEILENLAGLPFEVAGQRLSRIVCSCRLSRQPYGPAALGYHRFGIAALLGTFRFEIILCLNRERKRAKDGRSSHGDRGAQE